MRNYLLIDDDKVFNFIHSEVIKKVDPEGKIVIHFSGEDGLSHLIASENGSSNPPDLIFLDIRMPGIGGFDVLQQLETVAPSIFRRVRIYMLSASQDEKDQEESGRYTPVKGFLNKPLTPADLQRILKENYDL